MKVEKPRHLTTPEPPHISSSSCIGRCLYNIPQGTLIILMPGTVILLIGSFMTSLTSVDSSYDDHLVYMSWLFLIMGAIVTAVGIVFWCVVWTRGKPPPSPPKYRPSSPTESVQLVGVYKISDGNVNCAHTDDSGHASRAFNRDSGHREYTIEPPGHNNRTHTETSYQVGGTRADDSGHASAASDASRTHGDSSSCQVDIEHHTVHGHVNRAHTDDDGNVNPELSDNGDIVNNASRGDDGRTADVSHSNNDDADITAIV